MTRALRSEGKHSIFVVGQIDVNRQGFVTEGFGL